MEEMKKKAVQGFDKSKISELLMPVAKYLASCKFVGKVVLHADALGVMAEIDGKGILKKQCESEDKAELKVLTRKIIELILDGKQLEATTLQQEVDKRFGEEAAFNCLMEEGVARIGSALGKAIKFPL